MSGVVDLEQWDTAVDQADAERQLVRRHDIRRRCWEIVDALNSSEGRYRFELTHPLSRTHSWMTVVATDPSSRGFEQEQLALDHLVILTRELLDLADVFSAELELSGITEQHLRRHGLTVHVPCLLKPAGDLEALSARLDVTLRDSGMHAAYREVSRALLISLAGQFQTLVGQHGPLGAEHRHTEGSWTGDPELTVLLNRASGVWADCLGRMRGRIVLRLSADGFRVRSLG